ncbi:hypothetical protein [Burkholderia sp. ABCPW 14]|nr:hypothetical protein [Burkholderia sp. ABCPW 14]
MGKTGATQTDWHSLYARFDTCGTSFAPFFVQTNFGNAANRTDVCAAP